jgi:hypothetical protein
MGASNAARSWEERDDPAPAPRARSWAETVPYDILDDGGDMPAPPAPAARARRGPEPHTGRLQAMPGGRREGVTYRPPAVGSTSAAPAEAVPAYERAYRPRPAGALATGSTTRMALYGLGAAVAAVALYLIVSTLITWTQVKLDDMQYGNPRTTHLDAVVGHGDSTEAPTHFIAVNLNRQVSIIEIPGGDISKATAISGPYLFGDGEDLTPVHLQAEDVNGDGKPDLIVTVKNEQLVYINDKDTFRSITADEKTKLEAPAVGAQPSP